VGGGGGGGGGGVQMSYKGGGDWNLEPKLPEPLSYPLDQNFIRFKSAAIIGYFLLRAATGYIGSIFCFCAGTSRHQQEREEENMQTHGLQEAIGGGMCPRCTK